ncbi:DUF362 domain-containing protein [bacterium]|nr:DUF362 domain-containing protein [bacterium]
MSSRRQFLVRTAAGLAALQGGILDATSVFAAEKTGKMAIAKWSGKTEGMTGDQISEAAGKMARRAVEALGGMKRFVKAGETIWVKPNIAWDRKPEQAGNTNPQLVAEVVKMCLEAGAKTVKVGDNTCNPAQKTYITSGIAAAAEKAGAQVVYLDKTRFKNADIKGNALNQVPVYPEMLECDGIINVPILKHHGQAQMTMCLKNLMGMMDRRGLIHQDIPAGLADLNVFMAPKIRLHILDAVRTLKAHGPTGGNLNDVVMKWSVAAGTDPVAIDAWGAELAGYKPADIAFLPKCAERGVGKMDYRSLAPKEIAVS